ncbi:hypothetical protein [Savagea faecisuis]|mgnify:CR=1 FL=1|uniref:Uncharacterized protein n=1 Tax=Savagea faecisuis TaxID=1274803 RepID=A0ABW3H415_9BACL
MSTFSLQINGVHEDKYTVAAFISEHPDLIQVLGELYCLPNFELPAFQTTLVDRSKKSAHFHRTLLLSDALNYPWDSLKTIRLYRTEPLTDLSRFVHYEMTFDSEMYQYVGQVKASTYFSSFYQFIQKVAQTYKNHTAVQLELLFFLT